MPATARHHHHKLDEYLAAERVSPQKHEYVDGQVILMAGGSPRHNHLETRFLQLVQQCLEGGPCFTMTSNQRVATADGLYTYADGSVFCSSLDTGPGQTATNPLVLIEVLSPSTAAYDRGEKLARYQTIESLQHVVLVEQDAVDVEVWTRVEDGWARAVTVAGRVVLSAVGVELAADDIYARAESFPTG